PEGIAVAMPLRRMGVSRRKSFYYGPLSAVVEPIAAVLGAFAVAFFTPLLPYALAFAPGPMMFGVVGERIAEAQQNKDPDLAIFGYVGGFFLRVIWDLVFGLTKGRGKREGSRSRDMI